MVQAAFIASPESGESSLSVVFTNRSVGDNPTYLWNFRDGTTSTEKSPTHIFENPDPGTEKVFSVMLTATDSTGSNFAIHNIHVQNAFTADPDDLPTWAMVLLIVFGIIILLFIIFAVCQHPDGANFLMNLFGTLLLFHH
jgi:hypothetical protein